MVSTRSPEVLGVLGGCGGCRGCSRVQLGSGRLRRPEQTDRPTRLPPAPSSRASSVSDTPTSVCDPPHTAKRPSLPARPPHTAAHADSQSGRASGPQRGRRNEYTLRGGGRSVTERPASVFHRCNLASHLYNIRPEIHNDIYVSTCTYT